MAVFALFSSKLRFVSRQRCAGMLQVLLILPGVVLIPERGKLRVMERVLILNLVHGCKAAAGVVLAGVQDPVRFHPVAAH